MGVRQALNLVYAHRVRDMDGKQRAQFDADLHGWGELNRRGAAALRGGVAETHDPDTDTGGGEG